MGSFLGKELRSEDIFRLTRQREGNEPSSWGKGTLKGTLGSREHGIFKEPKASVGWAQTSRFCVLYPGLGGFIPGALGSHCGGRCLIRFVFSKITLKRSGVGSSTNRSGMLIWRSLQYSQAKDYDILERGSVGGHKKSGLISRDI